MDTGREKWGLAPSGGGFRASFFYLGVLARLAEMELLRHVGVISIVPGGSTIGALYCLHVKWLLEEKADAQITDSDYVALAHYSRSDRIGKLYDEMLYRPAPAPSPASLPFRNPRALGRRPRLPRACPPRKTPPA